MNWNVSDAKNRLSEVLDRADSEGPQTIQRRGKRFIVLPHTEYNKLIGKKQSFTQWLLNGPSLEGLELPDRRKSMMRKVDL